LLLEPACLLLATACLLLATACFLLSLYTKHTLIAAPAAAFFAIFRRDKRAALAFALALGAMGGAIYVALDAATNGAFTFGLITSNATVFLPDQLAALVRTFAITFAPLLILAGWSFIARVRGGRFGVLEAYALTAFAGLAMAGRVGAWENYFFEAIFVVCVLAFSNSKFLILNSEFKIRFDENLEFRVLALVLLLQLALFWRDPRVAANLIAEDLPANRQLSALLAHTDGTIISEDMGALVTSRQPVAYYTFQYSSLARSGKWDQSWELNGLSAGAFPLVVLERGTRQNVERYRRFTREFVSALDRYYARAEVIGKYEVYRPAPLAHLQFANFGDAIALVGWSAQPDVPSTFGGETLRPGTLELAVVWQAQRALTRRYTAFAHLENAAGGKVAQDDREPHGGLYPTVRWAASEMVREAYTLNVPGDLPRGRYVLKVGWYDSESGERLSVAGSADDTVAVGEWMYNGK
jgi:hypothetical protein